MRCSIDAHCLDKFEELLKLDGINYSTMVKSLNIKENRTKVFKAGEGAGASGSFFFFSNDNSLLIKTMNSKETKQFLEILDEYIFHIRDTKNKSLLARIYGVFTIHSEGLVPVDVMIMQNTSRLLDKSNMKY